MALAFHVLCPGFAVEVSVPPGPHSGVVAGCFRSLSKSWMTLSVVVQSWLFQYWVKNTNLFFHPVLGWSVDVGSGVDFGSAGLAGWLDVEAMVPGSTMWLGAADLGHACMGAT